MSPEERSVDCTKERCSWVCSFFGKALGRQTVIELCGFGTGVSLAISCKLSWHYPNRRLFWYVPPCPGGPTLQSSVLQREGSAAQHLQSTYPSKALVLDLDGYWVVQLWIVVWRYSAGHAPVDLSGTTSMEDNYFYLSSQVPVALTCWAQFPRRK